MVAKTETFELGSDTAQARIMVDAHVHLYPCFDLAWSFASACSNFAQQVRNGPFVSLLLLTETWQEQVFQELTTRAERGVLVESARGGSWTVRQTLEPESLELVGDSGQQRLFLIAGRQVQTKEGLEVLVAGTLDAPRDGVRMREAVECARSADALPVIPWGFGKWWGRRGNVLASYLDQSEGEFFLGDNGGRPAIYPEPRHFHRARHRGIRILPGSDPLPMASEAVRPGSYGFSFEGSIDPGTPCRSLKHQLRQERVTPRPFGVGEKALRFARNQVFMQLRKRRAH